MTQQHGAQSPPSIGHLETLDALSEADGLSREISDVIRRRNSGDLEYDLAGRILHSLNAQLGHRLKVADIRATLAVSEELRALRESMTPAVTFSAVHAVIGDPDTEPIDRCLACDSPAVVAYTPDGPFCRLHGPGL